MGSAPIRSRSGTLPNLDLGVVRESVKRGEVESYIAEKRNFSVSKANPNVLPTTGTQYGTLGGSRDAWSWRYPLLL